MKERTPEQKSKEREKARAGRRDRGRRIILPHFNEPLEGQPVVNRYDPAREIACRAMGIPYGELYVGAEGSAVRTHEMAPSGRRDAFISPSQTHAERQARRSDRAWSEGEGVE